MDIKTISYALSNDFSYSTSGVYASSVQFNNGANWSDQTANITPSSTTGVNLLSLDGVNYGAIGAVWYFGKDTKFDTISFHFTSNTDYTNGRVIIYEYWNGSAWTALPQTGSSAAIASQNGALDMRVTNAYCFKLNPIIYSTWATTTVNGSSSLYFLRMTVTTTAFTSICTLASVSLYDHFTNIGNSRFDSVFTTTDSSTFTDVTQVAKSDVAAAFTFPATTTSCLMYMGSSSKSISGFRSKLSTAAAGSGAIAYEYWNGSTWTALNYKVSGTFPNTIDSDLWSLKIATTITYFFEAPSDWATTAVNGVTQYWLRMRVSVAYTSSPVYQLLDVIKTKTFSRTVYIPETSNRTFKSVWAKIYGYCPITAAPNKFSARGRFDSGTFQPLDIGDNYLTANSISQLGGKVFAYDNSTTTYVDETNDASNSGINDITIYNTVNSALYIGFSNDSNITKFPIQIYYSSQGGAFIGGVLAWEYWNGSAWTAFTPMVLGGDVNGNRPGQNSLYSQSTIIPILSNWTTTSVNSSSNLYYIRRRIVTPYTTVGYFNYISVNIPGYSQLTFNNTGENNSFNLLVNLTSLFNSEWTSGTSKTLELEVGHANNTGFVSDFSYLSGELIITYSADTSSTSIKTVYIPIDSTPTALNQTLTSVGSNQIPLLDTYLPEASKTIRNFYIIASGNDGISTNIATEIGMRLDSDAVKYTWGQWSGGLSGNLFKYIFQKDDIVTSSTHNIQMSCTSRSSSLKNFCLLAVVTYEFDVATTTRAINSLMLPFETSSMFLPQDEPNYPESIRKRFFIEEPGTIDTVKIGAYLSFTDINGPSLQWKDMNSSTYNKVSWSIPNVTTGGYRDSLILPTTTLSRGLNTIGIDVYGEMQSILVPSIAYLCGYFIVNYHSDIASSGINSHNKTTQTLLMVQRTDLQKNNEANTLETPYTNWYINDFGARAELYQLTGINPGMTISNKMILEGNTTELPKALMGAGGGWQENESLHYDFIGCAGDIYKKYPEDISDHRKINIFDGGRWGLEYGYANIIGGMNSIITCHEITFSFSGSVLGYAGDGSGLTVTFYDDITSEVLFQTTTVAGGTFSGVWYDDTRELVCEVYDPTLDRYLESSAQVINEAPFTMDFNGGSGGGTQIHMSFT